MKKLTQDKIDEIVQLKTEKWKTYQEIADIMQIEKATVTNYLHKLHLLDKDINSGKTPFPFKLPEPAKVKSLPNLTKYKNRNDMNYASTVFQTIDTEEKAYWLGFLYADGSVSSNGNCISLSLQEDDLEHIQQFRSFLHLDARIIKQTKKVTDNKTYLGYRFDFSNKHTKEDLILNGCIPNKTFSIKFPSKKIVPSSLVRHFIRGYYDGDGSCMHGGNGSIKISIEILGTENFIKGYQNWTGMEHKIYGFNHSPIKRSIYGGPYAIYILDRLYENASIYLPRKYNTYLELRRLALKSPRTARLLAGKIGEGRAISSANPEVTL